MAFTIELVESRRGTMGEENPTVELLYIASGTDNEVTIRDLIDNTIPAKQIIQHTRPYQPGSGFPPITITLLFQNYDIEHLGGGHWNVRAMYGRRSPRRISDHTYNFDTGGGQYTRMQSIETVGTSAIDPVTSGIIPAPNYFGAINVEKITVKGVQFGVASYKWSETWWFKLSDINEAYRRDLKEATYTVNNLPFREFDTNEVLFKGVSGIKNNQEDACELTFHFEQSDNMPRTGFEELWHIGNLNLPAKKGHEHMWFRYEHVLDAGGRRTMVTFPTAAYVDKVYEETDFIKLGISTVPDP